MGRTVVVVGGGYAGTMVAKALDSLAEVTLVDPRDAFVNVSSSMRAVARSDWAHVPFFDYATLLGRGRVIRDAVTSADPAAVTLAGGGRVEADHLVLATGSSHRYPARPRQATTNAADAADDLRATNEQLARSGCVLILGAGPAGLELAGEIREAWPRKHITLIDPSAHLLPGYLSDVRDELLRQLKELDIDLRLQTTLTSPPPVPDATTSSFTVVTDAGEQIAADIWFRTFGSRPNTGYLADGRLVELTERHTVPVDEHLNVIGPVATYDHVYAVGDIADLPAAKMATHAMVQARTVIDNLTAQLRGEQPSSIYTPASAERILLPLGTRHGVGQLPTPDGGATPASVEEVVARKGADLFTARFAALFDAART
ncbi:NAD(P)/FAD-dependent oxidoreductase [Pseudonocardia sp. CA-107938]|uniref:NAD(P)/FAD-dependent oxidoreductase n=1 Tax=Pseudonocardia sp. CA-107938 TaxID=3240021 RepID=UPI003D8C7B1F